MVRIALLAGLAAACAPARDEPSDDLTPRPTVTMKALSGRRWIVPAARTAGDNSGGADGVMTAFLDLDDDDRLDPDSEPSTPCVAGRGTWRCHVEPRQITVLRSEGPSGTGTFVIPRWTEGDRVRYCVGDETGCDEPFASTSPEASKVRSSCGEAPVIWLDTVPPHHIALGEHAPIPATATLGRTATGDVNVELLGAAPERVFAWVGSGETPTWDSERSVEQWRATGRGLAITIPATTFQACEGCAVELAIAHHLRWRDADTSAMVVDVRERRFHLEVDGQ